MGLQKIVVIAAIVLALGASAWYFTQNNSGGSATDTTDGVNQEPADNMAKETVSDSFSGSGTFLELMARGSSFQCDFRSAQEGAVTEGTVYIDGGSDRYRMEANYSAEGETNSFAAITDGNTMYWWGDTPEGRMGMKMAIPEGENFTEPPESFDGSKAQLSADEEVEYDCNPWRVDASVFVPPSDVEFTDMQAMMEEMMQGMPEGFEMPEGMPGMAQ